MCLHREAKVKPASFTGCSPWKKIPFSWLANHNGIWRWSYTNSAPQNANLRVWINSRWECHSNLWGLLTPRSAKGRGLSGLLACECLIDWSIAHVNWGDILSADRSGCHFLTLTPPKFPLCTTRIVLLRVRGQRVITVVELPVPRASRVYCSFLSCNSSR